jgi:hypothetical protein
MGNPLLLGPKLVNKQSNPIIYNIAVSFENFKKKFFLLNDNYKKMPIMYNPILFRSRDEKIVLDPGFFRQPIPPDPVKLAKITFRDIFSNAPALLETINDDQGLNLGLNLNTYLRLTGS